MTGLSKDSGQSKKWKRRQSHLPSHSTGSSAIVLATGPSLRGSIRAAYSSIETSRPRSALVSETPFRRRTRPERCDPSRAGDPPTLEDVPGKAPDATGAINSREIPSQTRPTHVAWMWAASPFASGGIGSTCARHTPQLRPTASRSRGARPGQSLRHEDRLRRSAACS